MSNRRAKTSGYARKSFGTRFSDPLPARLTPTPVNDLVRTAHPTFGSGG